MSSKTMEYTIMTDPTLYVCVHADECGHPDCYHKTPHQMLSHLKITCAVPMPCEFRSFRDAWCMPLGSKENTDERLGRRLLAI